MTDVLIVGGGPAGTASALRLARAGLRVTLLERAHYPRHKPCAEYMSPGVVRELHRLGVGDAVEQAAGARLDGFTVYSSGPTFSGAFAGRAARPDAPDTSGRTRAAPCYGLGIPRSLLDEILARAAVDAGVELCEGVRVTDLIEDGGRVVGIRTLAQGRVAELRAPLVIGADGVRSVVARRLGALVARPEMARIALVAHLGGIEGLESRGEMHIGAGGYCGIAPLGGGIANVAMVLRPEHTARIKGRTPAFFQEYLRSLPCLAPRLMRAEVVRSVIAIGPLSFRARRLVTDGALLVGDAGGFYDPFTGQGVHRALVSAAIAARVVSAAFTTGDLSTARLAAYARRRRARFRANHAAEWLVQQFINRPALFARAARRLARDSTMADTLVGVTGDILPATHVLNPWFLGRLGV